MAYGDLKVRNLIWNTGSGDNTVVLSTLATQSYVTTNFAPKANPTFTGTINGADLILSGNLTVSGTQTIINTNVLQVEDKHIEIGKVSSPSDTTADGGGIILKASSDRTFVWINSTDAWTSSEHIQVASGKTFIGDGSTLTALNATNLASGTVPTARLGTGTAGSSNFLRGDGSWQTIATDKIEEGNTSVETIDTGSDGHVKVSIEGTERIRVSTNGMIGVNMTPQTTASNTYMLQMASGGTQCFLSLGNNTSGVGPLNGLVIGNDGGHAYLHNREATPLLLSTSDLERFRVGSAGQLGIAGPNYGSSGQVLTSGGSGAAPSWTTISAAPEVTGTASGSITAERGVIVKSDGTLAQVSGTSPSMGANVSVGSMQSDGNTSENKRKDVAYIGNGKIIVAYVSTTDTTGKYKIGTINKSTNSVTFGSEQSFETIGVKYISTVYDPDTDRIIITYNRTNNGYVRYIVGQYSSGDSVSWGTPDNVTGNSTPYQHSCYVPASQKVAVIYQNSSNNNQGCIILGTVNGSNKTISWTGCLWGSGQRYGPFKIAAVGNKKQVVTMWKTSSSATTGYGQCFRIHDNGSSLSQEGNNLETNFDSYLDLDYDANTDAVVFAGANSSNALQVRAVKFNDGSSNSNPATTGSTATIDSGSSDNTGMKVLYNPDTLKTSVYYGKATKFKDLTIDPDTMAVTVGSAQSFGTGTGTGATGIENIAGDYDTQNDRSCIFYTNLNAGNATTGGMSIRQHGTETTATTENFIGFSSAGYSDGNTATVKVVGNTSTQSSLTPGQKYYLQSDGTIGLTPLAGVSLEAGIALSSTKLLIKG